MKIFFQLLITVSIITFNSCNSNNNSDNPSSSSQTGSLFINSSMNNATLLAPDTDMKPASYNIPGTGPAAL